MMTVRAVTLLEIGGVISVCGVVLGPALRWEEQESERGNLLSCTVVVLCGKG